MRSATTPDLAGIGLAAADAILADHAPEGRVSYVVAGRRDGTLHTAPRGWAAWHDPVDVIIHYCGDTYDLVVRGEEVSGRLHTLRGVLGRRLARIAARIPCNTR